MNDNTTAPTVDGLIALVKEYERSSFKGLVLDTIRAYATALAQPVQVKVKMPTTEELYSMWDESCLGVTSSEFSSVVRQILCEHLEVLRTDNPQVTFVEVKT